MSDVVNLRKSPDSVQIYPAVTTAERNRPGNAARQGQILTAPQLTANLRPRLTDIFQQTNRFVIYIPAKGCRLQDNCPLFSEHSWGGGGVIRLSERFAECIIVPL